MRTTLDLDDKLLEEARRELDGRSKKDVIEEALREFVRARRRQRTIEMIGTFEIDLTPEDLRKLRGK